MNCKNFNCYACELHCHTKHSDGNFTVRELLEAAEKRKLDGICLTDHNTISGWDEIGDNAPVTVLKGIEWTTYFGHMLSLGAEKNIDWRDASADNIDEKMKEIHDCGGIVGIAHPYQLGTPICTGGHWDFDVKDFGLVDFMEVWSEGKPVMNEANQRAYSLWASLLDKGFKIAPTFGRDWHNDDNDMYKSACTYLVSGSAQLSPGGMKAAIKNGQTVVSVGPFFSFAYIGNMKGAAFITDFSRMNEVEGAPSVVPKEVRLLTNGGETALSLAYTGEEIRADFDFKSGSYYRAELWGSVDGNEDTLIAFTGASFVK